MALRTDSFRYQPPSFQPGPSLEWTLRRAFGPVDEHPGESPLEPREVERALEWARVLGLLERIADRVPSEVLRRELPEITFESLLQRRDELAARTLLLQELLDVVARSAAKLELPLIALKGIALLEAGYVHYGRRRLVDLDLLTSTDRAEELFEALSDRGFETVGRGERHHLPPLGHPRLGAVELHLRLPGLSFEAGRPATAESLLELGLVQPSPRLGTLSIPNRELLAAHAIAHALDQHGWSPKVYPVTRVVADLLDMADSAVTALLTKATSSWIAGAVSPRELTALLDLCAALGSGALDDLDSDAGRLLRHTMVAITRPDYRRKLRGRAALRALRRGQWSKVRNGLTPAQAVSGE